MSFHSFRYGFRDGLGKAKAHRDAVLAIGGWTAGGTEEDYGSGLGPRALARVIARIKCDVDLSPARAISRAARVGRRR